MHELGEKAVWLIEALFKPVFITAHYALYLACPASMQGVPMTGRRFTVSGLAPRSLRVSAVV